jgi:YbbR domain-containing protein
VNAPTKEVPVNVVPSGTMDSSVSDLTYRLDQDTVTVTGTQTLLDQIDRVSLPVDIDNITKLTQVKVAVPVEDGVTADPASILVTIVPTLKQTTESTSSSSTSHSSETTDKTSTSSSSQSGSTSSEQSTNSSESSESTSSDN